jgi:hypothetical protein
MENSEKIILKKENFIELIRLSVRYLCHILHVHNNICWPKILLLLFVRIFFIDIYLFDTFTVFLALK